MVAVVHSGLHKEDTWCSVHWRGQDSDHSVPCDIPDASWGGSSACVGSTSLACKAVLRLPPSSHPSHLVLTPDPKMPVFCSPNPHHLMPRRWQHPSQSLSSEEHGSQTLKVRVPFTFAFWLWYPTALGPVSQGCLAEHGITVDLTIVSKVIWECANRALKSS